MLVHGCFIIEDNHEPWTIQSYHTVHILFLRPYYLYALANLFDYSRYEIRDMRCDRWYFLLRSDNESQDPGFSLQIYYNLLKKAQYMECCILYLSFVYLRWKMHYFYLKYRVKRNEHPSEHFIRLCFAIKDICLN